MFREAKEASLTQFSCANKAAVAGREVRVKKVYASTKTANKRIHTCADCQNDVSWPSLIAFVFDV